MARKKICEVLVSTVTITLITSALAWIYEIVRNWHGQASSGSLVLGFFAGVFVVLIDMWLFIVPSALLISLLITSLKRWSVSAVAGIFFAVALCCSISAFLIDPTESKATQGVAGYFTSQQNALCHLRWKE
ncbi:MAG TPA: hypothetical protein VGM58_00735 [Verrucomicrobiae bacterium]|jgi:hypothetical protein